MNSYSISISVEAEADINALYHHIRYRYKQEQTAIRYVRGLYDTIDSLSLLAGVLGYNEYVQAIFGDDARHITYKKVAIIYFVRNETVYVLRVIAGALIH
jgi:plasmid stabilization system protein ParE